MATLVSLSRRFVFIHLAKTAGTSVTDLLLPYVDSPLLSSKFLRNGLHIAGEWTGLDWFRHTGRYILPLHATGDQLTQRFADLDLTRFYRFTIVRNPWDRLVSLYTFNRLPRKRVTSGSRYRLVNRLDFGDFVAHVCRQPQVQNQVDCLFLDAAGRPDMDFIGRLEHLEGDMNQILRRLEIPSSVIPERNRTSHAHYRDYYDARTRALVEAAYARDIEAFGYGFDD